MIDPLDSLAHSLHIAPGTQALLVGSGLSQAAGILTGWEITVDLIRTLGAFVGVKDHPNWEAWFSEKHGKKPHYSEILEKLASTPAQRQTILSGYIEKTKGGETPRPTEAHKAIARLVKARTVRVIITTNFDRLLETALAEADIPTRVIAKDDDIKGITSLIHSPCTLIKVHGDYLDIRIKNTDAELDGYSPDMNALLDQVFNNFGLCVVGWSGQWDAALRTAIGRVQTWHYPLYWAAYGGIGEHAKTLVQQSGGQSFDIEGADDFFSELDAKLMALQLTSQPNLQSVTASITLAKRYCRDDQFSMEWEEFLHAEVKKIRDYVTGPEYPTVQPNQDTLNEIVNTLMIRTEILRRACLICGKWGTKRSNQSVIQAIQELSFANESKSGYTYYVSLREFAGSICFLWNLVGLISNSDWQLVKSLFLAEIKRDGNLVPLVSVLHPVSYAGVDWKFLFNLKDRATAISDYLFGKFKVDSQDISVSESRADDLFDQAELFVSLECQHQRPRVETAGIWLRTPYGRFLWKDRSRMWGQALTRLEDLPNTDPIYLSGLLGGNSENSKATFQSIRRYFTEFYWARF